MSEFGKPRGCNNQCGAMIYFDAYSSIGHPTTDKWVPLEYKNGLKTDLAHECPNKKKAQNGLGLVTSVAAAANAATTTNNESLSFAESLDQVLQDYIRLKRLELAA